MCEESARETEKNVSAFLSVKNDKEVQMMSICSICFMISKKEKLKIKNCVPSVIQTLIFVKIQTKQQFRTKTGALVSAVVTSNRGK